MTRRFKGEHGTRIYYSPDFSGVATIFNTGGGSLDIYGSDLRDFIEPHKGLSIRKLIDEVERVLEGDNDYPHLRNAVEEARANHGHH